MIILMHSSKTMRPPTSGIEPSGAPVLLDRAEELVGYLRTLSRQRLAQIMTDLGRARGEDAGAVRRVEHRAGAAGAGGRDVRRRHLQRTAGRLVHARPTARYADAHLRILSGLYGILRPFDGISPYRLEMGYRLPRGRYANLYRFWGASIAEQLPASGRIVNLAANEYSKAVLPHVDPDRVVTPRFLTVDPASGEPKFVVVHAKIARGAFARWLVTARVHGTAGGDPRVRRHRLPVRRRAEHAGRADLRVPRVWRKGPVRAPHVTAGGRAYDYGCAQVRARHCDPGSV